MPKKLTDLPQDVTAYVMSDYLSENDESALMLTSKATHRLFQPHRLQKMANHLLLQVMHGEQEKAATILKIHPELLTMIGAATDYSGRTFETTAFRYALWALDTRYMCNMMLDCLPYSEKGEAIKQGLLMQFNAQVQNGLDYELNGVIFHESHYDFSPLKTALQFYVEQYDSWKAANHFDALGQQWSRVVGLAQSLVPAHVAQHYCDPQESFYPTPSFNKETFVRSLKLLNYDPKIAPQFWFTPISSTLMLGVNYGMVRVDHGCIPMGPMGQRRIALVDLAAMTNLCKVRTEELIPLKQRLEGAIQKPDVFPHSIVKK